MTCALCFYKLDMLRYERMSTTKKILNINFTHKKIELFAYISNKHLSVQIMHTLMEIGCLSPKFTYINILYYAKLILFFFFF